MRYVLDTEFDDDGRTVVPISYGVVADDGREFYAVSREFHPRRVDPWVAEHVLPLLGEVERLPLVVIGERLAAFTADDEGPAQFWAYNGAWDWYVTVRLFGRLLDIPPHWSNTCFDLKQRERALGGLSPEERALIAASNPTPHNALTDARQEMRRARALDDLAAWRAS